ncbi:hypothetical protein HK405_010958 [Cladochytrium tenue]|nr:hypothetical protein HK405_010958 [Cladochytrium tenue]
MKRHLDQVDDGGDGEEAAYDPDSFVSVGTAQPASAREVRDEKGRKRLHGAFTGGFSAGYFNTVGSKEGFQPSQFKSSRAVRAKVQQKAEDFMDEEDLAEIQAERRVQTTETFDSLGSTERELASRKTAADLVARESVDSTLGPITGKFAEDLIVPASDPIGIKLLRKMGWRHGQGVGPRVKKTIVDGGEEDIHASEHLFAPQDITAIILTGTTGVHGLGYQLDYARDDEQRELTRTAARRTESSGFAGGMKGGFGTGVLDDEDDEDVYMSSSKGAFSTILDDDGDFDSSKPKPTARQVGRKQDAPVVLDFWFGAPTPPLNFVPKYLNSEGNAVKPAANIPSNMTAEKRRELLGEEALKGPSVSVFSFMSSKTREGLQKFIDQASGGSPVEEETALEKTVAAAALKGFMPFGNDPEKQARYRAFLEMYALEGDRKLKHPPDVATEKKEFFKAAQIFRPLAGVMASRFVTSTGASQAEEKAPEPLKYGRATRTIIDFKPVRLLCKRFNVPNPFPEPKGGAKTDKPDMQPEDKEILNPRAMDELRAAISSQPGAVAGSASSGDGFAPPRDGDDKEPPRPALDIFRAIFADSDDDDDGDGDENKEGGEEKKQAGGISEVCDR